MAYCRNCGHDMGFGANFCPECGQDQNVSVPQGQRIETEQIPVPPLPNTAANTKPSGPGRSVGGFFKRALQIVVIAVLAIVILAMLFGSSEPSPEVAARTFTDSDYAELATDPAAFEGASVNVEGELLGSPEVRSGETSFQIYADEENFEWNTIVHTDSAPIGLGSNDLVRVRGKVAGAFEGENAFGATITAVEVDADSVEVINEAGLTPSS